MLCSLYIVADVWKTTPFVAVILLAGLQSIPKTLYEAAEIDGAGKIRQFFMITLPLLRPYILLALLFRGIQAFGVFDLIWVLTRGGPGGSTETVSLYIYDANSRYTNPAYAAALTIIVFLILFSAAVVISLLNRKQYELA
ncbi:MAG: sugar ABC transporter permease [Planctomycetota bacterium]